MAGPRSRRVYSDLPGLYDIDKSLFSKGTLGTLLSYRELLSVRAVDRGSEQKEPHSSNEENVTVSSGRAESLVVETEDPDSVTLRFFLEVRPIPFKILGPLC